MFRSVKTGNHCNAFILNTKVNRASPGDGWTQVFSLTTCIHINLWNILADKAGRALGIDATALAQTLDIEALVRAALDVLAYSEEQDKDGKRLHPFAPRMMPLRAELAKLPKQGT